LSAQVVAAIDRVLILMRMTWAKSPTTETYSASGSDFCRDRVSEKSIYGLL